MGSALLRFLDARAIKDRRVEGLEGASPESGAARKTRSRAAPLFLMFNRYQDKMSGRNQDTPGRNLI